MAAVAFLKSRFEEHVHPAKAQEMAAYMKNHFSFYGLQRAERWPHFRSAWANYPISTGQQLEGVVREAWAETHRELHYFGMETLVKYNGYLEPYHLGLLKYCITHQSWWDTVDIIAGKIGGYFFQRHPGLIAQGPDQWVNSNNIWLIRSALLHQLYLDQEHFDEQRLFRYIEQHQSCKEFFIAKAIGWALRQYGKRAPDSVAHFVGRTQLQPLSRKEALKHIA